jgi:hypothetical protein
VRLKRVNNYLSEEVNQIVESASYRRHEPRLLGLDGRPVVQRGLLLRPIKVPVLPLQQIDCNTRFFHFRHKENKFTCVSLVGK